ncbi:M3 family oligoendopeptidase [Brevundimonas sp.]|uniref:M3 family oligoendopeptidase n=1 Tax=Brevundimonas sp. TaxID=1871086 RepID=UPI002FC97495
MNAPVKPTEFADAPLWDLSDLYASREDARIGTDLDRARDLVGQLNAYQGKLSALFGVELGKALDHAIRLYEEAGEILGALGAFAFLGASTDRENAAAQSFEADLREKITAIATPTVWVTLEINGLDDDAVKAALEAFEPARRWSPWLRRLRAMKPHELSQELETFIAERGPLSAQWPRLFDETLAAMRADVDGEKLTLSEGLNRLSDTDEEVRRKAGQAMTEAFNGITRTMAMVLNTVAAEKALEDKKRGFARPADSRHLGNEVHGESVDAMADAVAQAYPRIAHRYYTLKAKLLGKDRLNHWDRNAPLGPAGAKTYDWQGGRELVMASFADLGGDFAERAGWFFDRPWIDARPRAGKQSGAYSHPVTAGTHPYVFLNWMGERRDVLTLAHELGHGVHQTLAAEQGGLLADTPLTLAETASIFAEGLTFDRLLSEATDEDRRALLAGRIEDGLNTVVRQIAFHRFETRLHDERASGELSVERISQIWTEELIASLGPSVDLEGYENWWAYVSHFVHSPFYVYAYAFGDLLVAALMETRAKDPQGFTPLYRQLLADGGTKTYVEALEPLGLNPRDPAFWTIGTKRLEGLVDQFEALCVSN